jgi:hypothetical protein
MKLPAASYEVFGEGKSKGSSLIAKGSADGSPYISARSIAFSHHILKSFARNFCESLNYSIK